MVIHLIDGTYELFRQFYGRRRGGSSDDKQFGAVIGVLHTVLQMIEKGATHYAHVFYPLTGLQQVIDDEFDRRR